MRPGYPIVFAGMVDRAHAITPGIQLARLVGNHGIIGPAAFPKLVGHVHEFFGTLVAIIVFDHLLQTEIARGTGQVRGHDVPADPAIGHVIQGAEAPGMGKRMLVTGGHGHTESQIFGDGCQCRNDHQRIIGRGFHGPFHGGIGIAGKHIVEAQHIAEKQHVQVSLIGDPGQVRPIAQRVDAQSLVCRVGPQAWRTTTADTRLLGEGKQQRFGIGHHDS